MTTTVNLSAIKHVWNKATSKYDQVQVYGTIRLDIDVEKIIERFGHKALINKSGRAIHLSGLVKATRIKR